MSAEIAVLMAAYNADQTLRQAVESVLASTAACRVFLIDDCSRVPVAELLGPMDRVEVIRLEHNQGLAAALNVGLKRILALNYKYIARMDADDVSYPERLAKQIAFLEQNPAIGVVGSAARFIDGTTGATMMYYRPPLVHAKIRNRLFFNNCFVHPSWVMRADVVARFGPYSLEYRAAEDYEFMRRISPQVGLANIPDYLLDYRISTTGISVSKRRRQLLDRLRIQLAYFEPLEWRAWAGALFTLLLFVIPMKWVNAVKVEWRGAPPPVPAAIPSPPATLRNGR
jgi:glycosyltransferase involved in cell wall biosynthesis